MNRIRFSIFLAVAILFCGIFVFATTTITDTKIIVDDQITKDNPTDIRYFGAIANDGLSDSSAIKQANEYLANKGGGTLYFPAGTWDINETIMLYGGIKYLGAGQGYIGNGTTISLLPYSNVTMMFANASLSGGTNYFPTVESITLDGNRLTQSGFSAGLYTEDGCFDIFLKDLTIFDTYGYGMYLAGSKVWGDNIYTEYCNKGVMIDNAAYVFINNFYDIFSYNRTFDIISTTSVAYTSINGGVIGANYGTQPSIYANSTAGFIALNNLKITGGVDKRYNGSAIINLSNSGTSFFSLHDSSVGWTSDYGNSTYGIWKGTSTAATNYELYDIKLNTATVAVKTNSVQYSDRNSIGTYYENQWVTVSSLNVTNGTSVNNISANALYLNRNGGVSSPVMITTGQNLSMAGVTFAAIDTQTSNTTDFVRCINGGIIGQVIILQTTTSSRDVTIRQNECGSASNSILNDGKDNLTLDASQDKIFCIYSNSWSCDLWDVA